MPRDRIPRGDADRQADGFNRLCGDKLRVFVKLADGRIQDLAFEGDGCCISKASSSMMTSRLAVFGTDPPSPVGTPSVRPV